MTSFAASLLRTRGGISVDKVQAAGDFHSSPHTRRYFLWQCESGPRGVLFSAHAEVFPSLKRRSHRRNTLLRTRGGISTKHFQRYKGTCSSPHTRRYFPAASQSRQTTHLFSAHAEVFPNSTGKVIALTTLLRTRGGISSRT